MRLTGDKGTALGADAVRAFRSALDDLVASIGAGDEEEFTEIMARASAHVAQADKETP